MGGTFHDILHTRWIREDLESVLGGSSGFHPGICGVSSWGVETRLVKYSWLMAEGWTLQLRCREERERRSRRLHELCGAGVGAEICGGGAFGG